MSSSLVTYNMLRAYALRMKTSKMNFNHFAVFVKKYSQHYKDEKQGLDEFLDNTEDVVKKRLEELSSEGKCRLQKAGDEIDSVIFPQYFVDIIRKTYKRFEKHPEIPFPSEEYLNLEVPVGMVEALNVKTGFVDKLTSLTLGESLIYRLNFPEGTKSMLVISDMLNTQLAEFCIKKMGLYLNTRRNKEYIKNKLASMFREGERFLKDMLNKTSFDTSGALKTLSDGSDSSFRFWNYFSLLVIKEINAKSNKSLEDHSLLQASHLLNLYSIYNKGSVQREKDTNEAYDMLSSFIRKSSKPVSIAELKSLKDTNGFLLTKRYGTEGLYEYLKSKSKPRDEEEFPEILRIVTNENKEYYIYRENVLPYCLNALNEISGELKRQTIESWVADLHAFKKSPTMNEDKAFAEWLRQMIKKQYPILNALLRYDLLYIIKVNTKSGHELSHVTSQLFDDAERTLRPTDQLVGLERKELYRIARSQLSIWESNKILHAIFMFFKNIFNIEKKARPSKEKQPSVEQQHVSTHAVLQPSNEAAREYMGSEGQRKKKPGYSYNTLKSQIVGSDADIDLSLEDLAEKWNPLYDKQAKENLVEDVNSLIRDYLRKMKRTLITNPPDAKRVHTLASNFAENKTFEKIRKRNYFVKYIEIYIVKFINTLRI